MFNHPKTTLLHLCTITMVALITPNLSFAQDGPQQTKPVPSDAMQLSPTQMSTESATPVAQTQTVTEQTFSGDVLKLDNNKLTVKSDAETKEFILGANYKVTRDGSASEANAIKPGDTIKVTSNGTTGEVLALDTTSPSAANATKIAVPAIIGVVVLLGLLYYLFRKKGARQIKTSTTKLQ